MIKVSIIIPVFNEEKTILQVIEKIENLDSISKQLIIVDDCSTDNSYNLIQNYNFKSSHKIIRHEKNYGKGQSIISAKEFINNEVVIIQDADLEYDPADYEKLLYPFNQSFVNAVYGSRVLNKNRYSDKSFTSNFRIFANHFLTIFSNLLNRQKLTDAHTCYKVIRASIFKKINLKEKKFAFCPEITTKLSKLGIEIIEIPISYKGRSFDEGKKIKFIDGIEAIFALIKYRFTD